MNNYECLAIIKLLRTTKTITLCYNVKMEDEILAIMKLFLVYEKRFEKYKRKKKLKNLDERTFELFQCNICILS